MSDEIQAVVNAPKDPAAYPIATYVFVIMLSAWGGAVRVLQEFRDSPDKAKQFVKEMAVGIFVSIFAGFLTFLVCEAFNIDKIWSALNIALSGHLGAKGIEWVQSIVNGRRPGGVSP